LGTKKEKLFGRGGGRGVGKKEEEGASIGSEDTTYVRRGIIKTHELFTARS